MSPLRVGLVVILFVATGAAVATAGAGLGPQPAPDQSRCAPVKISRDILHPGQETVVTAGPRTPFCGGPSSTVHWSWDVRPSGLRLIGGCPADASTCRFRAYLSGKGNEDHWLSVGVSGSSPQGGWGSGAYYAVLSKGFIAITGFLGAGNEQPDGVTVHLKGKNTVKSTTTFNDGFFSFAVRKPGKYILSATHNGFSGHVTVLAKDDTGVSLSLVKH